MTFRIDPIGDYWETETVECVARFYTRIHHKVPQMVIVYYDNVTHRQGTKYVDLTQCSVELAEED